MMMLTQLSQGPDIATCAVHEVDRPAIEIKRNSILDVDQPQEISTQRRFFSHGGQDLALNSDLLAEAFLKVGVWRVKGWGIEITPYVSHDFNLDREIIRKFLALFSKAEADRLSDTERVEWAAIAAQVDYQRFCAERSPENYMEGQLLRREEEGWHVAWHDGTEQLISREVGQQLALLAEGEKFGAMVKFGMNREVKSLAKLSFVAESATTSEELWQSWTTANS